MTLGTPKVVVLYPDDRGDRWRYALHGDREIVDGAIDELSAEASPAEAQRALVQRIRQVSDGQRFAISWTVNASGWWTGEIGPERLWAAPAYLDYVQLPLTDALVKAAEEQLGVTLPASYLAMLRQQNGGYLRAQWPDSPHRRLDGIGPHWPAVTARIAWWQEPEAIDEMWVPDQPGLLVSFDGEGHWDLCFDYREHGPQAPPAVAYIDSETEEDTRIANSFDEFLDGLVDEDEVNAIRLYVPVGLEELAAALGQAIDQELVDQGAATNGYRVFRASFGDGGWAWISPNRVPAGYRRTDDRDGSIVAAEATALRIPSDPACTYLVIFTPDVEQDVRSALDAAGLTDD